MSNPQQGGAAAGCATILVLAGVIVWFAASMFGGDDAEDAKVKQRHWSQNVLSTARAFNPLAAKDPASMTDEELTARLSTCRELIRYAADNDFVTGVQFPDKDWDGSLGAAANLAGRDKMATPKERVAVFRSGRPLDEQWLIFGVTDSFSGTQRTLRTSECTAVGDSVWVDICADNGRSFCNKKVIAID
jgi:hypothetical protein